MIDLRDVSHLIYSGIYSCAVEATDAGHGFPDEMYSDSHWAKKMGWTKEHGYDRPTRFYFYNENTMIQFILKWGGYTG